MASAIGRSNAGPSLRNAAGARLTVIRPSGQTSSAETIPLRTRSFASWHGAIGEADDRQRGVVPDWMCASTSTLHGIEPDERMCDCPREHVVMVDDKLSRDCARSVTLPAPGPASAALERPRQVLEPARAHDHHVEANPQAATFGMAREPGLRGAPHPPDLLGVHHLERIAESRAGLALHLAEHDGSAAAGDDVELVPAGPGVRIENPVGVQAVPAGGLPLRVVAGLRLPPAGRDELELDLGLRPVGERLKRAAVDVAGTALANDTGVRRRDVADVDANPYAG